MDNVTPIHFDNPQKPKILERFMANFKDDFSKKAFVETWTNAPIEIRYRCTNQCNENCIRCFERSGPECSSDALSPVDAKFYQNELTEKISQITWTGGEWSLIYDTNPNYMLEMFDNMDYTLAESYIIQTNCRWVFGKNRDKIFSDLKTIQNSFEKKSKILKLDLSVDRYRSEKSLAGVRELIKAIVLDGNFKSTKLRILSCALDYGLTEKAVLTHDYFKNFGISLKFEPRSILHPLFLVCHANGTRIVIHEEYPTMRIGKAADNKLGYKIVNPEIQCAGLTPNTLEMALSFREDNFVKWHNYYDWDIMIPFKNESGQNKPLPQIKSELIEKAWKKRFKNKIKENALALTPGINLLYLVYLLYNEHIIKKTYQENCSHIHFMAQKISR